MVDRIYFPVIYRRVVIGRASTERGARRIMKREGLDGEVSMASLLRLKEPDVYASPAWQIKGANGRK